jgi:hypothetical protein
MQILYVFQLEDENYFLYPAEEGREVDSIMDECTILYDFIHAHPIKYCIEYVQINDELEIDKHVKYYMQNRGIDHVRGGSYSGKTLPETTIRLIEHELSLSFTTYAKQSRMVEEIKTMYNKNATSLLPQLKSELSRFLTLHKRYHTLCEYGESFLEDIEWIRTEFNNLDSIGNGEQSRYRSILISMKQVFELFQQMIQEESTTYIDPPNFEPMIYLYRPDTILDWVFLHCKKGLTALTMEKLQKSALECLNYYEYMTNFLINRRDEVAFSMQQYGANYEQKTRTTINYLEN